MMRSVVLLPEPEGPTSTTNSPSSTTRSTPCTATKPLSYTFLTASSVTLAIALVTIRFPENFLWGAATSAYQIEGSPRADGAGTSIWQRFSHSPGRTHEGQTRDVACDHYRLYRDDVRLMAELGLNAYRFSIASSRVLPAGTGRVNEAGLGFYDRLVDALLEQGIRPNATLYHWDLPTAL